MAPPLQRRGKVAVTTSRLEVPCVPGRSRSASRSRSTSRARNGARVIALANQKGGVAKTTTVASLGAAFAESGLRVLLVDLDPQSSLTFSLGLDPDAVEPSIADVLLTGVPMSDVVRATRMP